MIWLKFTGQQFMIVHLRVVLFRTIAERKEDEPNKDITVKVYNRINEDINAPQQVQSISVRYHRFDLI